MSGRREPWVVERRAAIPHDPSAHTVTHRPTPPFGITDRAEYDAYYERTRLSRREAFPCPHCTKPVVAATMEEVTDMARQYMTGGPMVGELIGVAAKERDSAHRRIHQLDEHIGRSSVGFALVGLMWALRSLPRKRRKAAPRRARPGRSRA